jgi:hypothetical protein
MQGTGINMPKISYASTMIVEDHLKKCLAKTTNKPFKVSDNKLLPRAQHSPFGDFPKDFMPKKGATVTDIEPIQKHEQSIAAKGVRKYWDSILSISQGLKLAHAEIYNYLIAFVCFGRLILLL